MRIPIKASKGREKGFAIGLATDMKDAKYKIGEIFVKDGVGPIPEGSGIIWWVDDAGSGYLVYGLSWEDKDLDNPKAVGYITKVESLT